MKLDGWTREDAALSAPAYLTVTWPDLAIDRSPQARVSVRIQEKRRDEAVAKLKDLFGEARAYGKARSAEGKGGVPRHDFDPRLEALQPALDRKIPIFVVADRIAQIRAALAWAKEENVKIVIEGGRDAWRAAPELAAAGVPVVLDPVIGLPTRADEPYDAPYAAPGILAKAGVRIAITEGDAQFVRNLAQQEQGRVDGIGIGPGQIELEDGLRIVRREAIAHDQDVRDQPVGDFRVVNLLRSRPLCHGIAHVRGDNAAPGRCGWSRLGSTGTARQRAVAAAGAGA